MARLFGIIGKSPFDLTLSIPPTTPTGGGMHGWGICWYDNLGKPQIQKEVRSTISHYKNQPVTLNFTSYLSLSHVRFASSGNVSEENAHPFSFQTWTFAHSGTVHKEKIISLLKTPYNQSFQSEPIDSEVYFRYILQSMKQKGETQGIRDVVQMVNDKRGATFLLSDGTSLYAYSYGIPLYYLKWRGLQSFNQKASSTGVTYASKQLGNIQALVVSSEKLSNDNWMVMDDGELLIVRKNIIHQTVRIT